MRPPHARPYRPSIAARIRWTILDHWPIRWWWHLSQRQRSWWVDEYDRRGKQPFKIYYDDRK